MEVVRITRKNERIIVEWFIEKEKRTPELMAMVAKAVIRLADK